MNRADEIRKEIERLEEELEEYEEGIYHVTGDKPFIVTKGKPLKEINISTPPPTLIQFRRDAICFWCGATCFTLDIIPTGDMQEFNVNFMV